MFNPLKGLGDIRQLQKMQSALKEMTLTVEKDGVLIKIRGDQYIEEVSIDGTTDPRIAQAINEAVKKTQEQAAKKLMEFSNQ